MPAITTVFFQLLLATDSLEFSRAEYWAEHGGGRRAGTSRNARGKTSAAIWGKFSLLKMRQESWKNKKQLVFTYLLRQRLQHMKMIAEYVDIMCTPHNKGIVKPILVGVKTRLKQSLQINCRPARFYILHFKGTPSREEHKPLPLALAKFIAFLVKLTLWHFLSLRKMTYLISSILQYDIRCCLSPPLDSLTWLSRVGRLRKVN